MIGDIPLSSVNSFGWFFLITLALAAIGFIGWQLVNTFFGAKMIVDNEDGEPKYSKAQSMLLSGWLANRKFKGQAVSKSDQSLPGKLFFWMMIAGVFLQVAFWIYLVNFHTGEVTFTNT